MSAFRYVDQMERRAVDGGAQWRILRRTCTLEWTRVNERAGLVGRAADASPGRARPHRSRLLAVGPIRRFW